MFVDFQDFSADGNYWSHIGDGQVSWEITFAKALPENVVCLVFSEVDRILLLEESGLAVVKTAPVV